MTTRLDSGSSGSGYAPSELMLDCTVGQRVIVSGQVAAVVLAETRGLVSLSGPALSSNRYVVKGSTGKAIFGILA
jgi:hypothetical protein